MRTGGGDAGAGAAAAAASCASAAATASALDATFFGLLRGDCGEAGGLRGTVASHSLTTGARSTTMTKPCSMSYFKSLRAAPIARYCPVVVAVVHRSKFSLRRLRVRAIGAFLAMRLSTSSSGGNVAGGRGGWSMCADAQTHAASTNTNFETHKQSKLCPGLRPPLNSIERTSKRTITPDEVALGQTRATPKYLPKVPYLLRLGDPPTASTN